MTVVLRYSATTVEITPRTLVPLGGYLARGSAIATGTHDPLTASLLWLSGESFGGMESAVCWVALDALSIDTNTADQISSAIAAGAGIDADAVLVCCSHTHSGPATWLGPVNPGASSTMDNSAIDRLVHDLGHAARRLPATRQPATAHWSVVPQVGVGANRYNPTGRHDNSAGVLTIRDQRGRLGALLYDYACHPTVLGHANLRYSADFPAATRQVVTAALRAAEDVETPPVVAFLQGAAGDASTRFTRRGQTFAEVARQGGVLAGAVLRGALDGAVEPVTSTAPVVSRAKVRVPTRRLPTEAQARRRLESAAAEWQRERVGEQDTPQARIARTRHEGAQLQSQLCVAGLPTELELPISVVTLGDVAWIHLPVEPFASYAAKIRAASPFPVTRVVGYTDGYFGYLADVAGHRAGVYEALSSMFDPTGGKVLVAAAVDLLRRNRA